MIFAAGFLPFAALLYFIFRFHVNVPYGDEWEIARYLESWDAGRVTLDSLWSQHNEHRTFFPRIILLLLAKLTRWNLLYEEVLNALLAGATYLVLAVFCLRFERWTGKLYMVCLILFLPWLAFSFRQWENWSWGIQLVMFLSVFAAVAGLTLLAMRPVTRSRLLVAVALGILSQGSFSSGLVYWPAGLVVLWTAVYSPRVKRGFVAAVWCATAILITAIYLWKFNKPTHHPTLSYCLEHPIEYVRYVLGFLGSTLKVGKEGFTELIGLSGIALSLAAFIALWREKKVPRNLLGGLLSWSALAVLGALMVGIGRVGFREPGQELSSRYVTISYLFWVTTLLFGAMFFRRVADRVSSQALKAILRGSQALLFAGVLLIFIRGAYASLGPWSERSQMLKTARGELLRSKEDDQTISNISTFKRENKYRLNEVRQSVEYIRREKISLFAE
ncbi:MAG TPA: hypothetical protein VD883_04355 [Candidatus Omnitrophota bacterium]|nr:hypothetical protein [Candidatus Omnitrophota bacterium]